MSRSHVAKIKLDEVKLEKLEAKLLRRYQNLQVQIFSVRKMREGLKAAVAIAVAPAQVVANPATTELPTEKGE